MFSHTVRFVPALLSIYLTILLSVAVYAQDPSEASRESVINDIKSCASRHFKAGVPMRTELVLKLFEENEAGLTVREVAQIYEQEYEMLKAAHKPGIWKQIRPKTPWLLSGLLLILLVLRDLLKKWLAKLIEKLGGWVRDSLAGRKFFHGMALRRYKQSLIEKYQSVHVIFRPKEPLDMRGVYVPLKVSGTTDSEVMDAYQAVAKHRRLMVVGPPGSGKSMLLKHIALTYAEGGLAGLPDQPVPVLLALNGLNDPRVTVESELEAELRRRKFPRPERFVSHNLEAGTLMLLLDGLDEVNSSEREQVVRQITNLLDGHRECRAVITCRTAVYNSEFDDMMDQRLDIVEFDDQQIRRFLGSWEADMPTGKSIEQLMQTLHDRPRIMALARNPLLLTIIAYLYTDTSFILPHSRAEFYQQSTDVLLRQWKLERSKFPAPAKNSILQELALFGLDSAEQSGRDRRSIDYQTALARIRQLLPALNLQPDEDAAPILSEIEERSGLLLSIDGGNRYQFAHLSLQEFFAAAKLIGDQESLLSRFRADHDTWREPVKLWCGLAPDSSELIQSVYEEDPITAFECLADAQQVTRALADKIMDTFKSQLGISGDQNILARAFGTVASDLRPRGAAIFEFLESVLDTDENPLRRAAAANALSMTNLPQAAKALAGRYSEQPEVHDPLVRMGDLAVPALASLARAGTAEALDDLQAVGTPHAAEALVPLLWNPEPNLAYGAAWRMAALLSQPNVENVLRDYALRRDYVLREDWEGSDRLDWVWRPFDDPLNSALPVIAGRVAYLVSQSPTEEIPSTRMELDPRLIIPIISIQIPAELNLSTVGDETFTPELSQTIKSILDGPYEFGSLPGRYIAVRTAVDKLTQDDQVAQMPAVGEVFVEEVLKNAKSSELSRYLLTSLPTHTQLRLLDCLLLPYRKPRMNDWINVFRPVDYTFNVSWHFRAIAISAVIISLIALEQMAFMVVGSAAWFSWGNILTFIAAIAVLFPLLGLLLNAGIGLVIDPRDNSDEFVEAYIWPLLSAISYKELSYLLYVGWLPAVGYFITRFMLKVLPSWHFAVLGHVTLVGAWIALYLVGTRRDRAARNPLQGLIESPAQMKLDEAKRSGKRYILRIS